PRHHRVEPDDAAAATAERRHLAPQQRGIAGLVTIRHDHHSGAGMDYPRGMPAVEGLQALADPGAAAGALRHDRKTVERARRVLLFHRVGDMREPCMEEKRLRLAKLIEDAMDEAQEYAGVHAHRTRRVEQHDEPQRLCLSLPPDEVDRDAAMADVAVNGPPEIEPVAAPPRQIAPRQPR